MDPSTATPVIRLIDVHKRFGSLRVLRGIDLDVISGETTVVLGPSGCGKSVMLKHIVGLLRPDRGEIWFRDTRVDVLRERFLGDVRRQVGFLFQQGALFDSMTVRENVEFPLVEHATMSRRERRQRVEHTLDMVGVTGKLDRMPADLSGGQRKRVALARAIILRPSAILYDEPTTGLDPIRSTVVATLIARLKEELGLSSVVVTHDIQLAMNIADKMVMLDAGRICLEGTPVSFKSTTDPTARRFLDGRASEAELAGLHENGHDVTQSREHN